MFERELLLLGLKSKMRMKVMDGENDEIIFIGLENSMRSENVELRDSRMN